MSNDIVTTSDSGAERWTATENLSTGPTSGDASPRVSSPGRKAEIEMIRATDFDLYESQGLDREYRAILEQELVAADPGAGNPTESMPADMSRNALCGSVEGQKLVRDWDRMGGFNTHLANVQKDAGAIVRAVGDNRAQRAFMERFDRSVPEAARLAVYDEIASGPPTFVVPATDSEVRLFAKTEAGAALVAEWGSDTPERVATLRKRAANLNERMYDDEAESFWSWLENLDPSAAKAVFRKLAG